MRARLHFECVCQNLTGFCCCIEVMHAHDMHMHSNAFDYHCVSPATNIYAYIFYILRDVKNVTCKKRPNKYSSNNVDDSVRLLNFDPFFLYALHAAPFVRCYCCWCAFIEFIRVEKIQFIAVSKCRLCELMHTFCVIIVLAVSAYCSLFGPKL